MLTGVGRRMKTTGTWIKNVTKDLARHILLLGIRWKRTHPSVFGFAKKLLSCSPWLDTHIRTMMASQASAAASARRRNRHIRSTVDWKDCPAPVRKVYQDLKQAMKDRR